MHIFHKWDKWILVSRIVRTYPYDWNYVIGNIKPIESTEYRLKRTCKICGLVQYKDI